jgi:hypothetical protein
MADFMSGKHTNFRVYFNQQSWTVKTKTVRVTELGTEVTDQVNGENRARFQKLTDGYRVTFDCYEDGSSQILVNFLNNQSNEDANLPQLPLAGGLRFNFLDGTAQALVLKNCNLGPLDLNIGGRTERVMHTIVFRATNWGLVPAV